MHTLVRNIANFFRLHPKTDWGFVGILISIYIVLSLWHITKGTIWFDEAFSAYIIHFNFLDIARYTATDVHPPLFYWLLRIWASLFGHTDIALRSMSIFFGIIAALFGFLLVRRQFGRQSALTGLAVLTLSPLFIRYSQEARMYTLASAIVLAATYVLVKATETGRRSQWVLYGVLVAAGMWTHYFTALAWIAHWLWRLVVYYQKKFRGKKLVRAFFSKNWIIAYALAVGLFLPWIPAMYFQLSSVQTNGFWITAVGLDTVTNYFGTLVYFLEHDHVTGWLSLALLVMAIVIILLAVRSYRHGNPDFRRNYLLVLMIAAVPPILLFIASLPPLKPSFVERYLLPSAVVSAFFVGVTTTYGLAHTRPWKRLILYVFIGIMLLFGLNNMYFYGNYNKNSRTDIETKQLVQQAMAKAQPGEPIIASTPWVFYEAVFYQTNNHPVYFVDSQVDYRYGSLDMLHYSDNHKIKDIDAFTKQHPVFWYIGYAEAELVPLKSDWKTIDSTSVTSPIDGKTVYKGTEYTVN